MRALVIQQQGTPVASHIALVSDWPEPILNPDDVIIRTEATALNHLDLWVGRGLPGIDLTYPRISGSDACGIVESVGTNVDPEWVGERVLLNAAIHLEQSPNPHVNSSVPDISMIGEHTNGGHCDRFAAPVDQIVSVGNETDPLQASAFGLTFLTAWRCLITRANLRPGQTVLIPGIGGGVALAGLQICQHLGCNVIVTSRHQSKLDRALELGAKAGILDKGDDWSRDVRRATAKQGVDVALDSIGKATHLFCIKSLARGGTYVTPGCTTGPNATTDLARIFWNQLQIMGSTMGTMSEFREVTAFLRSGQMKPIVDSVFPPDQGANAFARIESGEQFGKVVIDWRTN